MQTKLLTAADRARWNAFVASWSGFHLMQTYEWGLFKEKLGWQAYRLAVEDRDQIVAGAQLLFKPLPFNMASLAYIPRGPLVNWEDEAVLEALLNAIHEIAHQNRTFSLRIEPGLLHAPGRARELTARGFTRSRHCNQPRCTMVIDLEPGVERILANMRPSTRYNIRYAARKGVTVREGSERDLPTLHRLLQQRAEQAGFVVRPFDYYENEWQVLAPHGQIKLFMATFEEEVLATRVVASFGSTAATFHSAHLDNHRNLKPNELLMWHCIESAKRQGCTHYDVWGIPDEIGEMLQRDEPLPNGRNGGLWGAYHFKRGFGGEFVYYVGAFEYVYSRPLHHLLNAAVSQLGSLDRLAQVSDRLRL